MEDYIDVLLNMLRERDLDYLGGRYYAQTDQAFAAMEALNESLSEPQKRLFLDYEKKREAASAASETALARQAFLLAKEIYH